MEILKHGIYYNENKEIECNCGCKFKYEQSDIETNQTLAYTTCPQQYERYIRCPECNAKITLATTYSSNIIQK